MDLEAMWALQGAAQNEDKMEGLLVKRGDRWLRRWEKRRFVLAFGVLRCLHAPFASDKSSGLPQAQS